MVQYRPVPTAQAAACRRISEYAFHPENGPFDGDGDESGVGDRYALFDDGRPVSVCRQYTFEARLREEWIDLGGLGGVATSPEHRGKGHAQRLLGRAVETFASDGVPLVALWPFETAFYRQFGWASANTVTRYECHPDALRGMDDHGGECRAIGPDDWQHCRSVHRAATAGETLSMRRSESWWRQRVFREWGDELRYAVLLEREGDPAGYLTYDVERHGDDRHLAVAALGASDHAALESVLGFLGRHGPQVESISFERGPDGYLLSVLPDPEAVDCTIRPGPMVRVTDVSRALSAAPYPQHVTGSVTLAVTDPLREDPEPVELVVEDDRATVTTRPGATPTVTLGVGALSQLLVGRHNPAVLAERGELSVGDAAVIETLAALFPPTDVYHREFY